MENKVDYKVNTRENIYFAIKVITSIIMYYLIVIYLSQLSESPNRLTSLVLIFYIIIFAIYFFLRYGVLMGYIKGNAVKVSPNQFPDLYKITESQTYSLGLSIMPNVYILQSGGVMNAFATNFFGNDFIVLYSEIVEAAYEQDPKILEFIIGHELGHIKRNHMIKRLLLWPSALIPFLNSAYSRACEYTCDSIGYTLSPGGFKNGLIILGSGRSLFKKVNVSEYISDGASNHGFWKWFAEIVSPHPNLPKRLKKYPEVTYATIITDVKTLNPIEQQVDNSKYMPM